MLQVPTLRGIPAHYHQGGPLATTVHITTTLLHAGLPPVTRTGTETPRVYFERLLHTLDPHRELPHAVTFAEVGGTAAVAVHLDHAQPVNARHAAALLAEHDPKLLPALLDHLGTATRPVFPLVTPTEAMGVLEYTRWMGDEQTWADETRDQLYLENVPDEELYRTLEAQGVMTPHTVRQRYGPFLQQHPLSEVQLSRRVSRLKGNVRSYARELLTALRDIQRATSGLPDTCEIPHHILGEYDGPFAGYGAYLEVEAYRPGRLDLAHEAYLEAEQWMGEARGFEPVWTTILDEAGARRFVQFARALPHVMRTIRRFLALLERC